MIFLGILGETELILGICGEKQNTLRELRIFSRDLGRSMHVTYAPAKIKVARLNGLGGAKFTRKYIILSLTMPRSHEMLSITLKIM